MTKNDEFIDKLEIIIKANMVPLVSTHEEEKFILSLRKFASRFKAPDYRVLIWSLSEGVMDYTTFLKKNEQGLYGQPRGLVSEKTIPDPVTKKPMDATTPIKSFETLIDFAKNQVDYPCLIVIKDFNHCLAEKNSNFSERLRKIKDLLQNIRTKQTGIIFLSASDEIPEELQKEIQKIDMPLPDREEIAHLLDLAIKEFAKLKVKIDKSESLKEKIILNLLGLTEIEISQVLTYTCVKNTGITESSLSDIKDIKKQIIERSGALEFIATPDKIEIGGHDRFKEFIEERELYLDKNLREQYHLKPPKGVCFIGPPGNGKSAMARYIGYKWQLPLIRLDMGAIYGHLLGESEQKIRTALQIAEANAPCVLWVDELEKALGGMQNSESSTTHRVFGKLLTWMAERNEMVFLYCTANNVDAIPPELLRAGRLDSVWWGDLPSKDDCVDILKIHCKLNKIVLEDPVYIKLAELTSLKEMTGAEIEHIVLESSYKTANRAKALDTDSVVHYQTLVNIINNLRPYAISNASILKKSRLLALNRFEFTSSAARILIEKMAADYDAVQAEFTEPNN